MNSSRIRQNLPPTGNSVDNEQENLLAAQALVGSVVAGKYRVVRLIGDGGMGAVFEAEHTVLGHRVAIKMMHRSLVANEEAFHRFLREAQACGALEHPNIVAARDFGVDDKENIFIVMELLRGESLGELLERRGPLPLERSVAIALQMLSGLHVAHAAGIVHRDLKPDNVFLSLNGRGHQEVKLLDFGVAKFRDREETNMNLTRTGTVIGTACYLSPEQARARKDVDCRADLWSVGVILYEMLSGQRPFEGLNYNDTFSRILLDSPPRLVVLAPHVPSALAAVVERALRKEPAERFASASSMLEALSAAISYDKSLMSSQVRQALQLGGDVLGLSEDSEITKKMRRPDSSNKPVISLPTLMEAIDSVVPQLPTPPYVRRRRMLLAGGVAVAGIAFVTAMVLWPPERLATLETVVSASSSAQAAAVPLAVPDSVVPTASEAPKTVWLEVSALPKGAVAQLDGHRIELPYHQEAGSEPHILRVFVEGREAFEVALVLDRHQVVEYRAAPKAKPKRSSSSLLEPNPKRDPVFLKNPF
ncbi:MAG: serine/threonine protein kinase [Myxococcota bacterium]|jgi:serine/threonine protein kinase|nr:serine/threonine protein kinase [Myxococcota bacterium]